jgi:mono/diheme cytochrome c family protein
MRMLAISTGQIVLLVVGGSILLLGSIAALLLRGRRKERGPDIPTGMKPGPSDADLETPLLQKLQGWGVVLVAFFVVWIPLVWLQEPDINLDQEQRLLTDSIARGERSVLPFSEENQLGVGCVRCHGPELRGGLPISATDAEGNQVFVLSADLTTVCQRLTREEIQTTIEEGRPPAMPSWSIRFAGALDDQQIIDLVNYIIVEVSGDVPFERNLCLNEELAAEAEAQAAGTA